VGSALLLVPVKDGYEPIVRQWWVILGKREVGGDAEGD
jgi:hypothetical protein